MKAGWIQRTTYDRFVEHRQTRIPADDPATLRESGAGPRPARSGCPIDEAIERAGEQADAARWF